MMERIEKQFEFIKEIDKLKHIGRQTYLADGSRRENDAEHSWHLAVMALLLGEYAGEKVDVLRVMSMVLIHDIVEIDAGDTYAYDEQGAQTQRERELAAAKRLFGILPEDQCTYLNELWEEFESAKTNEAKFAHCLDNTQPVMLNAASDGIDWAEHGVRLDQILKRNRITMDSSREIWEYSLKNFIEPNVKNKRIVKQNEKRGKK